MLPSAERSFRRAVKRSPKAPGGSKYAYTALQLDFARTPIGSTSISSQVGGAVSLGLAGPIPTDSGEVVSGYVSHTNASGIATGFSGHGAYTNMLQNSVFTGAVSGTPGTAPTNWTGSYVNGALVASAGSLNISSTSRNCFLQSVSVSANTTYRFSAGVTVVSGSLAIREIFTIESFPSGGTTKYYINGSEVTTSTTVSGSCVCEVLLTVGATAGTCSVRFGIGCFNTGISGNITISNPQVVASPYPHPYAATAAGATTSVPATSGSSSNNGLYVAMGDKLLNALDLSDHNYVPNSECVGGGVGALPTGWIKSADGNGITTAVVGAGSGYVDIRVSGTASAIAEARITPAINVATVAATEGQVWTFSCTVEKLSGSYPTVGAVVAMIPMTSGFSVIAPGVNTSIKTATTPVVTQTMPATTAFIDRYWSFIIASGETVDFTIRISKPQLTRTSVARKYVPTTGTTVTPNPAQFTCAAIIWHRGAGSAELPNTTLINAATTTNHAWDGAHHFFERTSGGEARINRSSDKTSLLTQVQTWSRDTFTLLLVRSTTNGTKFQIGYQRFNADCTKIDANPVWGTAANFDGSFNPTGFLRWLYGITVPTDIRWTMVGTKGDDYFTDARIRARLPREFR